MQVSQSSVAAESKICTSLVKRLRDVETLFGLLVSHIALAPAAIRKTVAGTMVRMVSSNKSVKSKSLSGPE
jgi:hypothetical protein